MARPKTAIRQGVKPVQDIRTRIPNGKGGTKIYGTRKQLDKAEEHGLTDMEFCFIQKVLTDPQMNITRAYLELHECTYETASQKATQIFNSERVQTYFNDAMADRQEKGCVTEDQIIMNLKSLALRCMQGEPIVDRDGKETGDYSFHPQASKGAWELLGKNLGMFKDRVELTGDGGGPIETINRDMSTADATAIYLTNFKKKGEA